MQGIGYIYKSIIGKNESLGKQKDSLRPLNPHFNLSSIRNACFRLSCLKACRRLWNKTLPEGFQIINYRK
jgi:hypothetical protein